MADRRRRVPPPRKRGICVEAIELLRDKPVKPVAFDALRQMAPPRQVEAVATMIAAGNFSARFAWGLLAATRRKDLAAPNRPKRIARLEPRQVARLERDIQALGQLEGIDADYGRDVLCLMLARAYVAKLIANRAIERYLDEHHPKLLARFRTIAARTRIARVKT